MSDIRSFIDRWSQASGAERANAQLFLSQLCRALELEEPQPSIKGDDDGNAYVYERPVTFVHGSGATSTGFVDLYRRGCFVLESKQGVARRAGQDQADLPGLKLPPASTSGHRRGTRGWDQYMYRARNQAESYARALHDAGEDWPVFLIVADVGYCFDLYADFTQSGRTYVPFPDPRRHRIYLNDLNNPEQQALLRQLWEEPLALDPSRRSAKVTREIAVHLAALARSLEASKVNARSAAEFLMRCLFTMFAEDVGLLPEASFTGLLRDRRDEPDRLQVTLTALWRAMDKGDLDGYLGIKLLRFNGNLFQNAEALKLTPPQIDLLIEAASADWREVEPAIFGTLLERALDKKERHKLGAHFTPRDYVERLVMPTLVDPLREDWADSLAAANKLQNEGKKKEAARLLADFHHQLCQVKVLDPACGSGNFLYIALEHMKRLEGEVVNALEELGGQETIDLDLEGHTVTPEQFLGLEINPWAATVAEMVLWIGYLQWHFRSRGDTPGEPILRRFKNIECRDALLVWDGQPTLRRDDKGNPVTRWDGVTMKTHPVTGKEVPDESARLEVYDYDNPRPADWPQADFILGNPPFIGNWRMRSALGDGYTEVLRKTYKTVPESVDFVMYWWHKAAELVRGGKARRFGLITTNSLRQAFARKVIAQHLEAKKPLSLTFAIPDHPWVDAGDGADVRIAMTVGTGGRKSGLLQTVLDERPGSDGERLVTLKSERGKIHANLRIGVDLTSAVSLKASDRLCNRGVVLHGAGFIVTPEQAKTLGLGRVEGIEQHIRPYRNGRDLTGAARDVMVIDLFGLNIGEVRNRFPTLYQWVAERVKPERDNNRRESRRKNWWVFGEPVSTFRPALARLNRYIATVETAKHRVFQFLDAEIMPDNKLINIALEDAYFLGVLSSRSHVVWALAAGGRLGVGNDPVYVKTRCFDPFPFPDANAAQKARIRALGERLDAHRKARQAEHPDLTLTQMYNVLEKLRAGEPLDDRDRAIHEKGLISILKDIHDALDLAVAEAYGWPADLPESELLSRLVALNQTRAAEEEQGLIRWLRPDYQDPDGKRPETQIDLALGAAEALPLPDKAAWPAKLPHQMGAVRAVLAQLDAPADSITVARCFKRAQARKVEEILRGLTQLGLARETNGRFANS